MRHNLGLFERIWCLLLTVSVLEGRNYYANATSGTVSYTAFPGHITHFAFQLLHRTVVVSVVESTFTSAMVK